jgi:hypothetical protein
MSGELYANVTGLLTGTASANVLRSGDTMTGELFANVTGLLTGTATANVLKAGDTMTGNLNMANTDIRWHNALSDYVGFRAPAIITASYALALPSTAPFAGQFLQALTDSTLTWTTIGGIPTENLTFYVAFNGSDSNDGSFAFPFATVKHAVEVANVEAARSNPVVISVGPGEFFEDNSEGPFKITNDRISIIGTSAASTQLYPKDDQKDFFRIESSEVEFANISLLGIPYGTPSYATAVSFESNGYGYSRVCCGSSLL